MAFIPGMGGGGGKELKSQYFDLTTTAASNINFSAGFNKILVGVAFTSATYIGMLFYGTSSSQWSCKVKSATFADVPNTNVSGYYYYYDA